MTREECERVLLRAEKSQIQPSTGTMAAALRATLDREAKARDAALEEAAKVCVKLESESRCAARNREPEERALSRAEAVGMGICANHIRALRSQGAR